MRLKAPCTVRSDFAAIVNRKQAQGRDDNHCNLGTGTERQHIAIELVSTNVYALYSNTAIIS